MTILMYDLAAADPAVRFSPNCWRIRMALAHKGLAVETVPWRFTDKEAIAPTGQGGTPVIVDGNRWIADSWTIAEYLDEAYRILRSSARPRSRPTSIFCGTGPKRSCIVA